jgi:hypothetical protein
VGLQFSAAVILSFSRENKAAAAAASAPKDGQKANRREKRLSG